MLRKSAAWSPFDFPLVIRRREEGAGEIREEPPFDKPKPGPGSGSEEFFSRKKVQEDAKKDQIMDFGGVLSLFRRPLDRKADSLLLLRVLRLFAAKN
jgi:hypothetical protein